MNPISAGHGLRIVRKNGNMVDFAELDVIAGEYWRPAGQPSLAFGVVRDGELGHWGGFGQRFLGGPVPEADIVFRMLAASRSGPRALRAGGGAGAAGDAPRRIAGGAGTAGRADRRRTAGGPGPTGR